MVVTRRILPEEAVEAACEWAQLERLGEEVSHGGESEEEKEEESRCSVEIRYNHM